MSADHPSKRPRADRESPTAGSPTALCWADRAIFAAIVCAPLAVGTVHPASWLTLAGLTFVAWALTLLGSNQLRWPNPLSSALLIASGATVLLPLVPLPPELLEWVSPKAAEAWARGLPGTQLSESWGVAHRAPGPGYFAVLRWCTAAAFFLLCWQRAGSASFRQRALTWVLTSGSLAILVCGVQTALESNSVLGLYEPISAFRDPLRATFINENHWAAFVGMILLVSVGELLHARDHGLASALLFSLSLVALVMLLIMNSRSGVLGAAVGLGVVITLHSLHRARNTAVPSWHAVLGIGASLIIIGASLSFLLVVEKAKTDPVSGLGLELMSEEPRMHQLPDGLTLAKAHFISGVGVGGFLDAFPEFRTGAGRDLAFQPEVLPLKLLTESGLLLGPLLFGLLIGLIISSLRQGFQHSKLAGAAAALCSLFVHEQADFASYTGGVLLTAALLLAVLQGQGHARPAGSRSQWLLLAGLLTSVVISTPTLPHWDLRADLNRAQLDPSTEHSDLDELAARLWPHHPSSFVLAQELGKRFAAAGATERAFSWLNRAMLLAPQHPDPHLMTSRLLRALGAQSQARIEFKLALADASPLDLRRLLEELLSSWSDTEAVLSALPRERPELPGLMAEFAIWRADPRRAELARAAFERHPEDPRSGYVHARTLMESGRHEEALTLTLKFLKERPISDGMELRLLHVLWGCGERAWAAERLAEVLLRQKHRSADAYLTLATWRLALGQPDRARVAIRHARRGDSSTAARALLLLADLEQDDGEASLALGLMRQARHLDPSLTDAWLKEVRLLDRLKRRNEARELLQQVPASQLENNELSLLRQELGPLPSPQGSPTSGTTRPVATDPGTYKATEEPNNDNLKTTNPTGERR